MTYAGNPAVSPEVRKRILGTFRQTLDLAAKGSRQEASLGCDFILQLDPAFAPARTLLERLRGSDDPVAVDDLRSEERAGDLEGAGTGADEAGPALEDELAFDLPDLPEPAFATGPAAADEGLDDEDALAEDALAEDALAEDALAEGGAPPVGETSPEDRSRFRRDLERLYNERRDEALLSLAHGRRAEVEADPELARLVSAAASRHEAAPYVERFLETARQAREEGKADEAEAALDKARALDPGHPEVLRLAEGEGEPGVPASPSPEPGGGGVGDGDGRIDELLAEGQEAFDRGDHQGAIDAWSRIFLIDIDHQEASRRIDEARRLKSEQEREVEEVFHDAQRDEEEGDARSARLGYERVLALAPGHLAARERLAGLPGGWEEEPDEGLDRPPDRRTPPPWTAADPDAGEAVDAEAGPAAEPLREEILVPPEPGAESVESVASAPSRPKLVAVRESKAGRRFALIGTLVLVVVAAASWLVYSNREAIFPNSGEAAVAPATEDPIARAVRLHEAGRTAIAINQLRRLPPTAPQYEEAQALISQWEAAAGTPEDAEAEGPSPRDVEARDGLLAEAREAAGRGEELAAAELLGRADEIAPLEGEDAELAAAVDRELEPIARLVSLYRSGDYEMALPELWRAYQSDGDDPDVRRMIVDSYYNLAVRELQRGNPAVAAARLEDALELAPDDPEVRRNLTFARTYADRERDLLYRIYVKYLPPR